MCDKIPNFVTQKTIEEGERLIRDPDAKRYSSVEELFDDLEKESY